MSWNSYIDSLVGNGQTITRAAIFSLNKDQPAVWASSAHFDISDKERQDIVAGFTDASGLRSNGIRIAGAKYFFLRADDDSIIGKLSDKGGVSICRSKTAVILGVYEDAAQANNANVIVAKITDALKEYGY